MRINLGYGFFSGCGFPANPESTLHQQPRDSGRTWTLGQVGWMAGRMLPMKHPVGQPIHRPRARPVRANNRGIYSDKDGSIAKGLLQDSLKQFLVPLRIGRANQRTPLSIPIQKTDAVVLFLPPGQIDSHQQDFHLHILPRPLPWRKADPQIAGSRLTPLVG